jgi:hypothetical protein
MKRATLLFLFLIIAVFSSFGQVLKGRIANDAGHPVPYATIYIRELRQGTSANALGDYELKLPAGKYNVTYQCMGFTPQYFTVTISGAEARKDVTLQMQYYMIPEVRISATGEDPAYRIMRKAIGMAPYYLNCISHYKADIYLKGSMVIQKIPALIKTMIKKAEKEEGNENLKIREGDVYVMESLNEVEFNAPDKYVKKVVSFNSTFPDTGDDKASPMDLIDQSLYNPTPMNMAISPLSQQAFSYYKFRYLGSTLQGDISISKILVTPKVKSQQLFEGTMYIIEDLWCIQSVDFTLENIVGKIGISQIYIPVKDDIWLPVTHKITIEMSILGFKALVGYGSSIRYNEVEANDKLHKPGTVTADLFAASRAKLEEVKPATKTQQKIDELMKKDELKNADMIKLAKLMEKQSLESQPDSVKNNLEIKNNTVTNIEKDAAKKDSAYWAEVRPIPLTAAELKSIVKRDSVRKENSLKVAGNDTLPKQANTGKKKSGFIKTAGYIMNGHTWSDTTGLRVNFGGLINLKSISFNTVDGFTYGTDLRINKNWKKHRTLVIAPDVRWAFSREKLNWRISTSYGFNPLKQRFIYVRAGRTSTDISDGGSINPLLNSISSLFLRYNYLKLYESSYLALGYRSEIVNGLSLTITGEYEKRETLDNTTGYSFTKPARAYTSNMPVNEYLAAGSNLINLPIDQNHFQIVTNVTFTPRQKYSIFKNSKVSRGSEWPTFSLTWKHGVNEYPSLSPKYRQFDFIRFNAYRYHDVGLTSRLWWSVGTGGFINNKYVNWYDFEHFNTQPLPVLIDNYSDAFRLPAYYSLASPEVFGEVHMKYTTPYLLLKYIPGFSKTLAQENLSISYLGRRYHKNYTEIGYSITQLFLLGELGVYAGFEDIKFRSAGVQLVFRIGN